MRRLELENDNLWAALNWARESTNAQLAVRLAAPLGWYFALAERVSEGRRFMEVGLEMGDTGVAVELAVEANATLCYLATEELDLETAIAAGERAVALGAPPGSPAATLAEMTLALPIARSGDDARARALAESARTHAAAAGDHWGAAASSLIRGQGAAATGDVDTVDVMATDTMHHAHAIGYDAFQVPAALLRGWV